ncbi:MAG: pyruvate kinase [Candidatus Bathyarchaeia archaeon]
MKKTKIICTIGPASISRNTLRKMYRAGMNGARINTAYGTLKEYSIMVSRLREVADIPIVVDLKGPEIRLRAKGKKIVNVGDVFELGKGKKISFNNDIYEDVDVGDTVLVDNGRLRTQVVEKQKEVLKLLAKTSGEVDDGKGVNIPNKKLAVPTLSRKDLQIIGFAKENDVEFMALSFTRSAQDIIKLRKEANGFKGAIIAKIENSEGVDKFNEILDASDGIMVARGDLGVEIEPEKVPHVQKSIIRKCNQRGKIVVTATEMLESMTHQPIPTRAEVSDVANAIIDGTEVTMLSGETAVGQYPVESVLMMSRIAKETEKAVESHVEDEGFVNISDTVSKAVQRICQEMPVHKVVTLTRSGYTARMISRFKIPQQIIAVTPVNRVKKQLELSYGVHPVHFDYLKEDDRILATANKLHSIGLIHDQDTVLFTAAFRTSKPHSSNLIEIHSIRELVQLTDT